jgi:protein-disulfide isomerase
MAEHDESKPVSLRDNMPRAFQPERDSRSRGLLYGLGIMIAAIFVIAAIMMLSSPSDDDALSEDDIRRIVSEAVGTQVAASVPLNTGSSGESLSSAELQQLVDAAVATQMAALIPTRTPIPPTPTVIPRGIAEDDDAFQGAEDAPVVIIEFSDFQCGFCGRWYNETLPKILEAYPNEVKFVYRDFVIFGEESLRAATATECAEEQDQFWGMHNRLFDRLLNREDSPLNDETFVRYADELGMDTDAFSECLTSGRYEDEVLADYQAATGYGLGGTPGFVINGVVYPIGAQSFEVFSGIIEGELSRLESES